MRLKQKEGERGEFSLFKDKTVSFHPPLLGGIQSPCSKAAPGVPWRSEAVYIANIFVSRYGKEEGWGGNKWVLRKILRKKKCKLFLGFGKPQVLACGFRTLQVEIAAYKKKKHVLVKPPPRSPWLILEGASACFCRQGKVKVSSAAGGALCPLLCRHFSQISGHAEGLLQRVGFHHCNGYKKKAPAGFGQVWG